MQRTYVKWLQVCAAALLVAATAPALGTADEDALKKQIKDLNSITGNTDAVLPKVRELIKDKDKATKLVKLADDMAKLDSKQFKFNAALALAKTALYLKENEIANRFYKICEKQGRELKSATKVGEGFEGQLQILYDAKKFEEAQDLCVKLMEYAEKENSGDFRVLAVGAKEQLVVALTRQGRVEKSLEVVDELVRDFPGTGYFIRLRGDVLHDAGRDEEAVKAYLDAIDKTEKSEGITPEAAESFIERTRYQLSNIYVELNQVDKAAEQLKSLLKKKPDDPGYNNDLGYIWADHDMNLDEAEMLIRKALEDDKKRREERRKKGELLPESDHENGAYLDSLGWVLFKKKKFAEAKKPLLDATKTREGEHIEILDHLADVHMALGEKTEAIAVWKKALEMDTTTKRELKRRAEVIKKLKAAEGKSSDKPADKK